MVRRDVRHLGAQARRSRSRARAEVWWRTTLRSIGDAVIATDAAGRVRFMNPVAERLTGWTLAEATRPAAARRFPIFNEETGAPVENPVDKVLREGTIVGLANHTVLRAATAAAIADRRQRGADPRRRRRARGRRARVPRRQRGEARAEAQRAFLARASEELNRAARLPRRAPRIAQLAVPRLADWCGVDIVDGRARSSSSPSRTSIRPRSRTRASSGGDTRPIPDAPTGVPNVIRTGKSELYPEIPRELLEAGATRRRAPADHPRARSALGDGRAAARARARVRRDDVHLRATRTAATRRDDLAFAEELARRAALIIERRKAEEDAERSRTARRTSSSRP